LIVSSVIVHLAHLLLFVPLLPSIRPSVTRQSSPKQLKLQLTIFACACHKPLIIYVHVSPMIPTLPKAAEEPSEHLECALVSILLPHIRTDQTRIGQDHASSYVSPHLLISRIQSRFTALNFNKIQDSSSDALVVVIGYPQRRFKFKSFLILHIPTVTSHRSPSLPLQASRFPIQMRHLTFCLEI